MGWVKAARPVQRHYPPVYRIILALLSVVVLLGCIGYWFSADTARSLVTGALICSAGQAAALAVYFAGTTPEQPRAILRFAYLSEIVKLVLTVGLFIVAFSVTSAWQPLALFAGFMAAQLVYWVTVVRAGRSRKN